MYDYPQITKHYPKYEERRAEEGGYGMFGYKGGSIDAALRNNDADGLQKAFDLGWINPDATVQSLKGESLIEICKARGLDGSMKKLQELGFK
jgi:hypothetical protein